MSALAPYLLYGWAAAAVALLVAWIALAVFFAVLDVLQQRRERPRRRGPWRMGGWVVSVRMSLIFARARPLGPCPPQRRSGPSASEAADPVCPVRGRSAAVTVPSLPPPGGVRGDREAFQERAARDALRCARGCVVVAPVSCPVHEVGGG